MTKRSPAKKQRRAFIKAQTLDYVPLSALEILPGDEVELENGDRLVAVGVLQSSICFRPVPRGEFVWPAADALMRVLRSPNRERREDKEPEEIDPLLVGARVK